MKLLLLYALKLIRFFTGAKIDEEIEDLEWEIEKERRYFNR